MKDLYTTFVSKFLFPVHERFKGHHTARVLKEMEASQWWPLDKLQDLQVRRLRGLLEHARDHVPYYRELFHRINFSPHSVQSIDDLQRLPLLSKQDIRMNLESMKADRARDLTRFNTGGSTGEPLIFFMGKQRFSHDVAAKWRATRWWNVDIGDRELVVWGSPIEIGAQDRVRSVRDRVLRTQLLPAFEMSKTKLGEFIDQIVRVRPKMLFGYPSAFAYLAQHARDMGQDMDALGIEVVFVTSECLYPHQRELIEEVFGCPVANGYGGRDAGFIAHQCPAGGLHITAESVIVEIVDANNKVVSPGCAGEVAVTHLATADFPFIRYRTGDIAVRKEESCSCGRGLPLMDEIKGRATDFIVAQDGTVMHGLALIYIVRGITGVKEFKVIQESLDQTRILLVIDNTFDQSQLENIRTAVMQRLGASVNVTTELVDEILPEASGKYRYVVSHVAA